MGALRSLLRGRRPIVAAIIISLLVHLIVATRVQWPFAPPAERVETVRIDRLHVIRIARMPTPPPQTPPPHTPAPQPSATASSAPTAKATRAPGTGRSVAPAGGSAAKPVATPEATPHPSPTNSCGGGDTPAAVASAPPYPEIASAARGAATNGTARVDVKLDANGAVRSASIAQSSGNGSLDVVALALAKAATYTPATHLCKPVASAYVFTAKFVAW